ncbi:hypothetical protein P168DRAFT_321408 [Aspergillus campestris IBT 28561]|uniref:Uncharacterized protein n=1 Tax=Aspergillus campestris (strain IBT 28561) TaxID=1392248 RepID=A0A2I1CTN4_ASPC2|nr:uncharacterized protein P168DRAFT_321408 [Aspergillus campestris IBT 28561]PKY00974.1 hypothetical protein P168DRAFT_321408 [Aspergillus campestris IBT 28561]
MQIFPVLGAIAALALVPTALATPGRHRPLINHGGLRLNTTTPAIPTSTPIYTPTSPPTFSPTPTPSSRAAKPWWR